MTTALVVLVAGVIGGGYFFLRMSQTQYYIGADSTGELVVYHGINYSVLGISLSSPSERTGIMRDQVPQNYQETVTPSGSAGGRSQVLTAVATVRTAVNECKSAYLAQAQWVTIDNAYTKYQAAVAANKRKHPPASIASLGQAPPKPGQRPLPEGQLPSSAGGGQCPQPGAFHIQPGTLTPTAPGSS